VGSSIFREGASPTLIASGVLRDLPKSDEEILDEDWMAGSSIFREGTSPTLLPGRKSTCLRKCYATLPKSDEENFG